MTNDIINFFMMYKDIFDYIDYIHNKSEYDGEISVEATPEFRFDINDVFRIEMYFHIYFYPKNLPEDNLIFNVCTDVMIFHDFDKQTGEESFYVEVDHKNLLGKSGIYNNTIKCKFTSHEDNKRIEVTSFILKALKEVERLYIEDQSNV